MSTATARAIDWTEQGLIPDPLIRAGIRRLLRERLRELAQGNAEWQQEMEQTFIEKMNHSPVALMPQKANEQHYEIPSAFYDLVLGTHNKYSCAYWSENTSSLDDAESDSLLLTCAHGELEDGMDILELGCGWGSLTLWMAKHYPNAHITAVSNSNSQREYIDSQARQRGLNNIRVITSDMNEFEIDKSFDRVVSVEMFEHMRNYRELFRRISGWLKPGGRFFMHIFTHCDVPYPFEDRGDDDWMSRHFFSGGIMPSDALPLYFQEHLKLARRWRWDGTHYEKTSNAWLANMDQHKSQLWPVLANTYGEENAQQWWMRWRMFFMACAELFGFNNGQQWWVSHYLFERPAEKAVEGGEE